MLRRHVLCAALLIGAGAVAHAELTDEQTAELQHRLEALATSLEGTNTTAVDREASSLLRWVRQTDARLPVDWFCTRAKDEASGDFRPGSARTERLRTAIRALAADLATTQTVTSVDTTAARRVLNKVLAEREYQYVEPQSWWQTLLARFTRWVARTLGRIFGSRVAQQVANVAYYIVLGILLLPLFLAVGWLIWRQIKARERRPVIESTQRVSALESPEVHRARAEGCLAAGDYLEAVRQFYLAVLSTLEQRGFVAHDRTRTNWEYLAQLEARLGAPLPVALMRTLNRMYDGAVYGAQSCDLTFAREFSQTSSQLLDAAVEEAQPRAAAT